VAARPLRLPAADGADLLRRRPEPPEPAERAQRAGGGAFVPDEGEVFIDSDYSQVELVVLASALERQFRFGGTFADRINAGQDIHRLIAAAVLGKDPGAVSKAERNSAKPISFGRPGGMGAEGLRQVARSGYGCELTLGEVGGRIEAYHRLCPELDRFLQDEADPALVLARAAGMTPADYSRACGRHFDDRDPDSVRPAGWLGWMLLKVLRGPAPATASGRPYTPRELAYLWRKAGGLRLGLPDGHRAALAGREPSPGLAAAVRDRAGRRPVFTLTGRLRAGATFCSARNTVFQGPAADGAVLGLWAVWRAGYKIVSFVHDQVVVAVPADGMVDEQIEEIEGLMKRGMLQVAPGMLVNVETAVTRSFHKGDLDPRYRP
jgi:hypothetical protein